MSSSRTPHTEHTRLLGSRERAGKCVSGYTPGVADLVLNGQLGQPCSKGRREETHAVRARDTRRTFDRDADVAQPAARRLRLQNVAGQAGRGERADLPRRIRAHRVGVIDPGLDRDHAT